MKRMCGQWHEICIYIYLYMYYSYLYLYLYLSVMYIYLFSNCFGYIFHFRLKHKMQEMDVLTNKRRKHVFTHVQRCVCVSPRVYLCVYELNTNVQQISPVLYFFFGFFFVFRMSFLAFEIRRRNVLWKSNSCGPKWKLTHTRTHTATTNGNCYGY